VVIFQHGITRNRTDALAIARHPGQRRVSPWSRSMQPLHGIADPANNPLQHREFAVWPSVRE
jgi:hypothetical protein